jgi:transposase
VRQVLCGEVRTPSLTPRIYFRALLIGYFEGIGAERGIAWRLADSLALRRFVGIALDEYTPDHSTISRTRRLIDLDTHREVFALVLGVLADRGLLKGQRIAIDATARRIGRAQLRALLRDGRDAALPSARTRKHSEAAVSSCGRV